MTPEQNSPAPHPRSASFEEFLHKHDNFLVRRVRQRIREDEFEDVLQEVRIRLWQSHSQFRGESSERSWAGAVLDSVVNTNLRALINRKARFEGMPVDDEGEQVEPEDLRSPPAAELLEQRRLLDEVQDFIEQLSEQHRQVMLMRYAHGLGTDEIARALDMNPNTVRVILMRTKNKLKTLLPQYIEVLGQLNSAE